jgi:hypothetical protein
MSSTPKVPSFAAHSPVTLPMLYRPSKCKMFTVTLDLRFTAQGVRRSSAERGGEEDEEAAVRRFGAEQSPVSRNNLTVRAYSRLRVFGTEIPDDPQAGMTSRKVCP